MNSKLPEQRLPNLRFDEFREVDCLENDLDMEVFVEPVVSTSSIKCPHCGSSITVSHGPEERFFRDLNMYNKRVGVAVRGRRYKCRKCNKTFVLEYSCIDSNSRLSKRLRDTIQKQALNRTFTSVAEEYGLGASTVERAFDEYTEMLNLRPEVIAPRVLGIDECHLQKAMHAVYVDIENAIVLEMGNSIKKADVIRDLKAFKNLDNVEVVTTDMCSGYRSAISEVLPNAIHVVDKFHVIQMFISAVDEARRSICSEIKERIEQMPDSFEKSAALDEFSALNVDAYMFRMNPENMPDWRLDLHNRICMTYPELHKLAVLRKEFFKIYEAETKEQAISAFASWRNLIPRSSPAYAAMRKLAKTTFKNWGTEIFNYFKVNGRKTNATTERLNGAIKSMQNTGRGYSFRVLRAKILFGVKTTKPPLYRRISQLPGNSPISYQAFYGTEPDATKMPDGVTFSLPYSEGGGTIQSSAYYGEGGSPSAAEISPEMRELLAHSDSIVRTTGLELLENGGAPIEDIITFCQEHGECI